MLPTEACAVRQTQRRPREPFNSGRRCRPRSRLLLLCPIVLLAAWCSDEPCCWVLCSSAAAVTGEHCSPEPASIAPPRASSSAGVGWRASACCPAVDRLLPGCCPAGQPCWPFSSARPSPQPGAGGIAPRRHCPFTSALPRIAVVAHACPNTTGAHAGIAKSQHGVGSQNRVPKWWSTEGNRNFHNSHIADHVKELRSPSKSGPQRRLCRLARRRLARRAGGSPGAPEARPGQLCVSLRFKTTSYHSLPKASQNPPTFSEGIVHLEAFWSATRVKQCRCPPQRHSSAPVLQAPCLPHTHTSICSSRTIM